MNKIEFMEGIKKIQSAYNTKFEKEKLEDWYNSLKDLDYIFYINRVEELRKINKYMPSIADIRNEEKTFEYKNYEQRKYTDIDFDSLYAN